MTDHDENQLIAQRRQKLEALRAQGRAYANDFRRDALAADLHARHGEQDAEALEAAGVRVAVAGRMMAKRVMGKASFAQLQDLSGRIQLFLQRDALGESVYREFKGLDVGDIVGAEGTLFRTRTGELSVRVERLQLLTKSLRPLPEKWHGLTDQEQRYRQRYVDLLMNPEVRQTFATRAAIVTLIRDELIRAGFLEVETPMMQSIPGGAAARPFVTHHNALGVDLYLRIAPELFLKRLVVGGMEKVFEINRNFRNEGLSTRHNPEFTMLEFYEAYVDYTTPMDRIEAMLRRISLEVTGKETVTSGGIEYDFSKPFRRVTLREAVLAANPGLAAASLAERESAAAAAERLGIAVDPSWGPGAIETAIFEHTAEPGLEQPTFVTRYPTEVSPLARQSDDDPAVTDRFELIVGGRELANGFSELNDPEEQAARFRAQSAARDAGDHEAMYYDSDYIRALEYGLPPTAGAGVGIDRVVMLFTDSPSIRDVVLFPQMRPEAGQGGS
ncbi:MAG: lysine--tRNA ligase [Halofilum sp. (in: g-proteobacteria)]|nr:lysine--tRNA ligase [Halofilum sp. (in: g-proteobacteria)]